MKRRICSALLVIFLALVFSLNRRDVEVGAVALAESDPLAAKSAEALKQRGSAKSRAKDFAVVGTKHDRLGKSHVRFRQMHNGIPVWGGEAIVHLDSSGSVEAITDDSKDVNSVNSDRLLSSLEAVEIAKDKYDGSRSMSREPVADLWVLHGTDRDRIAYRVQLERIDGTNETAMPVYFVDGETGEIAFEYDNFQTARGASQYSGSVEFESVLHRKTYYLEDLTRMIGTFDYAHNTSGGYPLYSFIDKDNNWIEGGEQTAAIDAHWGAIQVYDYYRTTFGRSGIDGIGGPKLNSSVTGRRKKLITSGVHYASNFVNAGWTGEFMIYGDGDGVQASALTTLDVVGHEFTHGVTQNEAGLIYSGESGALNEALSDIFGSVIESRAFGLSGDTWKIGEDCWTPAIAGDALRHLDEPHRASNKGFTVDDDPDHYSERYTGPNDNGGVHINSGIVNKQFYLLANGGTHHLGGEMSGIGTDAAAAIWYHALTNYMTSGTDFACARIATINASNALYGAGSLESVAVHQAWSLVGIN